MQRVPLFRRPLSEFLEPDIQQIKLLLIDDPVARNSLTKRDNQLRVDRLRRIILRAILNLGEDRDNREDVLQRHNGVRERRVDSREDRAQERRVRVVRVFVTPLRKKIPLLVENHRVRYKTKAEPEKQIHVSDKDLFPPEARFEKLPIRQVITRHLIPLRVDSSQLGSLPSDESALRPL